MYNVLIVDDERQEREVIKYLFTQLPFNFNIYEAKNGQEGLEILERHIIDILITDVKMPFMDGIQLAEYARNNFPDLVIIFFSGHDDFNYLKKALVINATNYFLKPVSPKEFYEIISSEINKIEQNKKIKQNNIQKEKTILENIIRELVNGHPLASLKKKYHFFDFCLLKEVTYIIICYFDNMNNISELKKIEGSLDQLNNTNYFIQSPKQIIIFFTGITDIDTIEKNMGTITNKIISNFVYEVTKEIIKPNHIYHEVYESEKRLEKSIFYRTVDKELSKTTDVNVKEELLIEEVISSIKRNDILQFDKDTSRLIKYPAIESSGSIPFIRFLYANFIEQVANKTMIKLPRSKEKLIQDIFEANNIEEIIKIVKIIIEVIRKNLIVVEASSNTNITNVKKYILTNYDKELYLDLLAQQVALSPRYLSELFKREEGIGINKYIMEIRMNEAKNLLETTNEKVTDIAEAVGYNNYSYFVKMFREKEGLPPEKYRKNYKR